MSGRDNCSYADGFEQEAVLPRKPNLVVFLFDASKHLKPN